MEKPRLMKLTKQETGVPDHFSLVTEGIPVEAFPHFFKALNRVQSPGNFEGQQIGPVRKRESGGLMDRANRLKGGYSAGPDLFRKGQFSERSGSEEVKSSGNSLQQSSMRVLTKNHSFAVP